MKPRLKAITTNGYVPHEHQELLDQVPEAIHVEAVREYEKSPSAKNPSEKGRREGMQAIIERITKRTAPAGDAGRFSSISLGARDFLDREIEPPASLLGDGLLCSHAIGMLGGKPGLGKTFFVLQLARALARGESFFGLSTPPEGVKAGLLFLEGHEATIQKRLRSVLGPRHPKDGNIEMIARPTLKGLVDIMSPGTADQLATWIETHELRFLAVDPLKNAHTAEENSNDQMGAVCAAFQDVAYRTGAGIFIVHHESSKGTFDGRERDPLAAFRGASRIADDSGVLMLLRKHPTGQVRLCFPKVRDGEVPKDIWLRQEEDGTFGLGEDPGSIADKNAANVRSVLEQAGVEGISRQAIEAATGLRESTVKKHLAAIGAEQRGKGKATIYRYPLRSATNGSVAAELTLLDNELA